MKQVRYRFQIQFDVYAKKDLKAVKKALKVLKKVKKQDVFNSNLVWGAESPFKSLHQRDLDISSLEHEILSKNNNL